VPFLLAALAIDRFLVWFQRYRKLIPVVTRVAGAVLVLVGLLLASGYYAAMAGWLSGLTPEFLRSKL